MCNKTGKFIVFEGLDRCGKTTQISLLSERLKKEGIPHFTTREPSDNPIGRLIRSAVHGECEFTNETLALLFAADRHQHAAREIIPALTRGEHVICDRYYYSNMAYQSFDAESLELVVKHNDEVMALCRPDITFFVNVSPAECMKRINNRNNGTSTYYETLYELELIYDRYMAAIDRMKTTDNIVFVGSDTATPEEVVEQMWTYFHTL
ncbi:MAG: dTMP kinase [Defluviitaleaceae bacterium]|nr:dTMP kinase [Defluviitaleaceae bacterium]